MYYSRFNLIKYPPKEVTVPVNNLLSIISSRLTTCLFLCLALVSCTVPVKQNRYQQLPPDSKSNYGAVVELQQKAKQSLATQNTRLAIEYLERAIKIEPRNPVSWHYLAQGYYQLGLPEKCLAMLDRSMSYGYRPQNLDQAGRELRQKCRAEING